MSDANPYRSPEADDSTTVSTSLPPTARLGRLRVFAVGAVLGGLSFIAAIALIPSNVPNPSVHDLLLANYLGFLFPPLVGFWSGLIRHSWKRATSGVVLGLAIGGCYYLLCGYNFLDVMVAFPCLLGGVASMLFGSGDRSWFDGILARLGKGLLAGFVLGFVYMVVLNVVGIVYMVVLNVVGIGWFPIRSTQDYHRMMWHSGTVAMSVASGLYLVLFVWASNLRSLVLEGTLPSVE